MRFLKAEFLHARKSLGVLKIILPYSTKFPVPNVRLIPFAILLTLFVTGSSAMGQTSEGRGKNNPYSPSPVGKVEEKQSLAAPAKTSPNEAVFIMLSQKTPDTKNLPTVAQRLFKITKHAESRSMPPTEIYRVGVGDILFVNLKNAAQGSRYCTVRPDGTIDFPLAGEDLLVADQTVDDIEEMLATGITLFPDPQLEVKVREYASHKITVSGMVDNAGDISLQREAMPLFVIRSEAVVSPNATKAVIKRAPLLKPESYDLRAADTDNVLIYSGNSVEFTSDKQAVSVNVIEIRK